MICKLLLFVHTVGTGSMAAKLTILRFLSWKILVTGVTLLRLNLLCIRFGQSENIISHVKLHPFVSHINLVGLILNLIHHCGCWRFLIFVLVVIFILIIISCVMRGSAHALILS